MVRTMLRVSDKLSRWYPCSVNPARPGFYEARGPMIEAGTMMHWNGRFWGGWHQNPFGRGAHYIDHGFGSQRGDAWRGVVRGKDSNARQS